MRKVMSGRAGFVRAFLLGGTAATAICSVPALAQDEATPAEQTTVPADDYADGEDYSTGNTIIVTATKREQTLQDVPVAVTVTTAETLERGQIRDLKDLQTVVPSLIVGQRQSTANTNFFIRGFGNGANNAGIEPSVGVFVDGVYRSRTAAQITELPDVQRIEVLRGPQSTLFGKNASAGVISISTMKPAFDWGGSAELTYGNYETLVAKALVTGPVSENTAISLAGGFNKRDGFYVDGNTGDRTNERDRWFVRGQALFESDDGASLRLIADYDSIDENCCAVFNLQNGQATPVILALGGRINAPADAFNGTVYNNFNSTNDIANWGLSGQAEGDFLGGTLTGISAYRHTSAVTNQDADFTSADLINPLFQDLTIGTFTGELRWTGDLSDRLSLLLGAFYLRERVDQEGILTYGTQFRPYANLLVQGLSNCAFSIFPSACATPGGPTPTPLDVVFGTFEGNPAKYLGRFFAPGQGFDESYALRSNALSLFGQIDFEIADGLTLTLGGNYTNDRKSFRTSTVSTDVFSAVNFDAPQYAPFRQQVLFQGALATTVGTQLGLGRMATADEIFAFATGASPAGAAGAAAYPTIVAGSTAFANANVNNPLANPLNPLRVLQFLPPFLNLPNAVEDGKTHDKDFSYTARLAYDVNNSLNVYASYATGFKASSINLSRDSRPFASDRTAIIAGGLAVPNLVYGSRFAGPEDSRVIELGAKYNAGGVSVNLAVFDQVIKGFQSNLFTGTGFALLNAGKQSTRGAEIETLFAIGEALTLNFGATYLDPEYDSFVASAVGDLSGRTPAGIPEWTVVVGGQYEFDLGFGLLVPRASYLYASRVKGVEGLPGFLVKNPDGSIADAAPAIAAADPFTIERNDLTASIDLELDMGLTIGVWGRNLLKDRNIETIFDSVAQPRGISGYISDPRTYGVTARFKW